MDSDPLVTARLATGDALEAKLLHLVEVSPEQASLEARKLLAALPERDVYRRLLAKRTLGCALTKQADYPAAKSHLQEAQKLAQVLENERLEADILNLLALCSYFLNDFESALSYSYNALEASREAGERLQEAAALHSIGWVYDNFSLYHDALESFLAELSILEDCEVKDGRKGKALSAIGVCYMHLQDFDKAVAYLESSLVFAEEQGDIEGQALALRNLGSVADERERPEKALRYYEQSFELYEQVKQPYELARQYLAMGRALANLHRDDEARSAFTQALVYLQHGDNIHLRIDVSLCLSELAERQGRKELALERLEHALTLCDEEAAPADAYRVHRALASAYKARGDAERALAHFETFHELKERVQQEAEMRKTKGLLLQFDVERLRYEREMYRLRNVDLARAYAQLKELSIRDPLTNLYNRRYLTRELAQEVERARRYDRPLSVMLCDIDNFKHINDSFGHQVGDEVLIAVAQLLGSRTRSTDIVARYGGEEIVIVFPEIALEDVGKLCQTLCETVATHAWHKLCPGLKVTLSIGAVELTGSDDSECLLRRADIKMYEAKNSGKNRVCV